MTEDEIEQREIEKGRRAAPRMDLSLPGKFLAVHANHSCIITSLSRTGLMMAIEEPLEIGDQGYLRCGPIDHFMIVTRKEAGRNALEFDIPVSDHFVFGIRQFQEQLEEQEQAELAEMVYAWTQGESSSHW